jgi:PAS domain S-box-containing protein
MTQTSTLKKIKARNRLSIRVVLAVILCSSFLTLLATAFQLYFDYQKDVKSIHANILFIEESYLPAIISSVYTLDMKQVKTLLEGSLNLIDIKYLEIEDTSYNLFKSAGDSLTSRDVIKIFPLDFSTSSGKTISLGTLKVYASFAGIYQRILEKALVILLSNMFKTFIAAILFLIIINYLVIRHLGKLSNFTRQFKLEEPGQKLSLDRKVSESNKSDELDQLVSSMNDLHLRIRDDMSKLKEAAIELRLSQAKYQSLYDNAPDMYVSVSPEDASILMCNQTLLNKTGYAREEIIGAPIFKLYHQDCMEEVKKTFKLFKDTGAIKDKELILKRKDNSRIFVSLNVESVRDDAGKIIHSASSWRDISARKIMENELREYRENLEELVKARTGELEDKTKTLENSRKSLALLMADVNKSREELGESNKELEAFSYSVSHDLRAPLRAIGGFTRILMEDYSANLDDEGRELGGFILQNTQKMAQLIDDLLAFSRMSRASLSISEIDMQSMALKVYNEITTPEERERIEFSAMDLPKIAGDSKMMYQVWQNLIANAVKFSSIREQAIISISCQEDDNEFVFCVKDNGTGFDMKYVDKLFGVFQRLHSEQEFAGTGVGLSLVKRIIKRYEGDVRAVGENNVGAAFYFTLPKRKVLSD